MNIIIRHEESNCKLHCDYLRQSVPIQIVHILTQHTLYVGLLLLLYKEVMDLCPFLENM